MRSKGPINNFICESLRQLRIAKGIKVLDVAEKTGIPASSYSCLEWGRYKLNLDNLFRILYAVGADIKDVWPMANERGGETVTSAHIQRVLEKSEGMRPPQVSVDDYIDTVCRISGIERMDRAVARSSKKIREAQVLAAIIVKEIPQITLTALSHRLDVNISSLSHRTRRILSLAEQDRDLREKIDETRQAVLSQVPLEALAMAS